MSSDVTPAPKSVPPASASLKDYPIHAGMLALILLPMAAFFWARLERLDAKIDRLSEQVTDIRVDLATQSGQLTRVLELLQAKP